MGNIIAITRSSFIVMLALLGIVVGAGMVGYSLLKGPVPRASLQTAEGVINDAQRVTHTSRRTRSTSSYYEMTLRPIAGGAELKLRVPSNEIAETDVRSLIGRSVRVEYDTERDVYALRSAQREVLTYENTVERRRLSYRQYYVDGIAVVIGSSAALMLGYFLGFRRLRRQAAAQAGA